MALLQLSKARAEEFYGEHAGKPFFGKLVSFMTSGPIVAAVLARRGAIKEWRSLLGPTNSEAARQSAPDSIRAVYGTDGTSNAAHGSDSPESAQREIKFFFPTLPLEPPEGFSAEAYVAEHLQPTLLRALTAMCKEKPSAQPLEAVQWLSDWLLDNNPNKGRAVAEDDYALADMELATDLFHQESGQDGMHENALEKLIHTDFFNSFRDDFDDSDMS